MNTRIKLSFILATLLTSFASASESWQIGTIAGAEYDSDNDEASPVILPWLAYSSDHWQINPIAAMYRDNIGPTNWRAGLSFNHGAWENNWQEVIQPTLGAEMFLGPIRLDNSVKSTIVRLEEWETRHTTGVMFPISQTVLLGMETGFSFENNLASEQTEATWVNGLQMLSALNQWRFMALLSWDQNLSADQSQATGLLSVAYEW